MEWATKLTEPISCNNKYNYYAIINNHACYDPIIPGILIGAL